MMDDAAIREGGNWVVKFLHVKSVWKWEEGNGDEGNEVQGTANDQRNDGAW